MLTAEHVKQLVAPFRVSDHEFRKDGMIYLTEESITRRLDMVDPSWSFSIDRIEHRDNRCTVYVSLTVCDATRQSNGMEKAKYAERAPALPENEVNEREKAAVTDGLKRAARLFGIGRYMLDMPQTINNPNALRDWLERNYPETFGNPFNKPAARDAITAALKQHGIEKADVLARMVAGRTFTMFSELVTLNITPDDVMNAIPAIAEQLKHERGTAAKPEPIPFGNRASSGGKQGDATPSTGNTSPSRLSSGRVASAESTAGTVGGNTTGRPFGLPHSPNTGAPSRTPDTAPTGRGASAVSGKSSR